MSIPCPCGGGLAYSRQEVIEMEGATEEVKEMWASILGPDDYYCPHEDDVLLECEVRAIVEAR